MTDPMERNRALWDDWTRIHVTAKTSLPLKHLVYKAVTTPELVKRWLGTRSGANR